MKRKLTIDALKSRLKQHTPDIMIGLGVVGIIAAGIWAATETPKALKLLKEKEEEVGEELTTTQKIKTVANIYIPAAALAAASVCVIVAGNVVNSKRRTALAAAYALSEKSLGEYREKVIETIGKEKEKEIRDSVRKKNEEKSLNKDIIVTGKGKFLCCDTFGVYFRSDIEELNAVQNRLNATMINQDYVSLNDLYYELDISNTKSGNDLGWNIARDGLIQFRYEANLSSEGEPYIVLNFAEPPKYDYAN